MAFSKEKMEEIKKQLISQIETQDFPDERKEELKEYIEIMDEEQLEEFLKKNNIQISESDSESKSSTQCIFCSIISGKVPSYKLEENEKSVAILEINPLSKGHSLIIPKSHLKIEEIPKSAMSLAQKISKRIKSKFKPEEIKIETINVMGHALINIIPIYKNEKLEKKSADEKELKKNQSRLELKKRTSRKKVPKTEEKLKEIHFRIP